MLPQLLFHSFCLVWRSTKSRINFTKVYNNHLVINTVHLSHHKCRHHGSQLYVFISEDTQIDSEWSQGLLLPMTVMLTTGAFIKSAVPGKERRGEERRMWRSSLEGRLQNKRCPRGGQHALPGQRTNRKDKIGFSFERTGHVSTNPPSTISISFWHNKGEVKAVP